MIKSSRGCCGAEELAEVKEAFEYGYFGLAYKTSEFEKEIAKFLGMPYIWHWTLLALDPEMR